MTINFYLTQSFALINRGRLDLNHLVVWVDSDVLNLHIYKRNTLTREAGGFFSWPPVRRKIQMQISCHLFYFILKYFSASYPLSKATTLKKSQNIYLYLFIF